MAWKNKKRFASKNWLLKITLKGDTGFLAVPSISKKLLLELIIEMKNRPDVVNVEIMHNFIEIEKPKRGSK